jgi:hypothetical protein
MILELIVNVFATQYALEVVDLICCQCRVRKRLMVNDGKRCSAVIANCFSHVSILTWHLFPRASLKLIVEPRLYMLLRFQKAAGRGNHETGNQAFSKCLRFLTIVCCRSTRLRSST